MNGVMVYITLTGPGTARPAHQVSQLIAFPLHDLFGQKKVAIDDMDHLLYLGDPYSARISAVLECWRTLKLKIPACQVVGYSALGALPSRGESKKIQSVRIEIINHGQPGYAAPFLERDYCRFNISVQTEGDFILMRPIHNWLSPPPGYAALRRFQMFLLRDP